MAANLCGAKTQQGGKCRRLCARGRNRCKFHGGATRVGGPTHHAYKHGLYSKVVPAHLRQRAIEASSDPELLSLRNEAVIETAIIAEKLDRLGSWGAPASLMSEARSLADEVEAAEAAGDEAKYRLTVGKLVRACQSVGKASDLEREIEESILRKARVVKEEWRRLSQLGQMISAERAHVLIQNLVEIVRSHIKEPRVLDAVARDIGRLTNRAAVGVDSVGVGGEEVSRGNGAAGVSG